MAISVGSYTKALGLVDLSGAMMRLAVFGLFLPVSQSHSCASRSVRMERLSNVFW